MSVKQFAKYLVIKTRPVLIIFLGLFFDRRFLTGRHFETGTAGFKWAARSIWQQFFLRLSPIHPFPVATNCFISKSENITFHPDDLNNFQTSGSYYQNMEGKISIGRGTYIAPNVGIITSNHDINDLNSHSKPKDVWIGKRCWIGMNSIILPGVTLGDDTIIGAGSVVTKSFKDGKVIIAGSPAKVIKSKE